jgi:hypothetical protein
MKKVIALASLVALATSCGSAPKPVGSLSLTTAHSTVTVSGKFRLSATPSNIANISKVEFFDGDSKLGEDTTAPYAFNTTLTSSNNGTKNYKAIALDSSNTATSSAVSPVTVNIVAGFALVGSHLNTTENDYVDSIPSSLAVDANDVPYMVFTEAKGKLVVKKWLANAWQQVGEALAEKGDDAAVSLDSNGNPVVSYTEFKTNTNFVYVKRWTGSAWQQLGGSLIIDPTVDYPGTTRVALDSSDNPMVVWNEYKGNHNLYAKKWNGSAWQQMGEALDNDIARSASNPSLAMTPDGAAVVAWEEFNGTTFQIHAKKWNGSMWQKLGGVLNVKPTNSAYRPAVALDPSGNPMVAWQETVGTNHIFVKKWDGTMWQQVGDTTLNLDTTKNGGFANIKFDATGTPVVVWRETLAAGFGIFAKKWTGSTWQQLGSSALNSNPALEPYTPVLAFDSQNNPFVGWVQQGTMLYNAFVIHFNQ